MTTGQKYSGKGDSTTQPIESGSNIEQTVSSDPQAAKPTLSANTFSFDELVMFDSLSDTGKTIIAALVNSGNYRPKQLSKALLHVSQTPDTLPPSEEFNGESLESILTSDTDEDKQTPQPLNIVGCREAADIMPIAVNLPFFLRWQFRNQQQAANLFHAIETVFWEFTKSKVGQTLKEDMNQMLAYKALEFSIEEMFTKAAEHQLGSFVKPKPGAFIDNAPTLAINTPESDKDPLICFNPHECTDIIQLQEWVDNLQKMARLQEKITSAQAQMVSTLEQMDAQSKALIEGLTKQVSALEQTIESSKRKAVKDEEDRSVASASHHIDLTLFLAGGYESEVEIVREALHDAGKAKLEEVFKHMVVDETEDAFFAKETYDKIQEVLARLTGVVIETADDNYNRHDYTGNPKFHLEKAKKRFSDLMERKGKFVDAYSVFTRSEDDVTEDQQ